MASAKQSRRSSRKPADRPFQRRSWLAAAGLGAAIVVAATVSHRPRAELITPAAAGPATAPHDHAAMAHAGSDAGFRPTLPNAAPPTGPAPNGMVWIPGGEFSMGAADPPDMDEVGMKATNDSRPIHRVYVDAFWMDATVVTNAQFAGFVRATHYVTVAERTPTAGLSRRAAGEHLCRRSGIHPAESPGQPRQQFPVVVACESRELAASARSKSSVEGRDSDPVVAVSYEDAVAYAKWNGTQLPTEAEWEFAARGGLSGKPFVWGDDFRPNGKWMANTFQGTFPVTDRGEDGSVGLMAVAQFPPNGYGLYDMAGNVWEWTSDWYRPDYYQQLAAGGVARNPTGPSAAYDPAEPTAQKRVHRGGSFLCTDQYCSRYMVGTRGKGDYDTGANHLGFRTIKTLS